MSLPGRLTIATRRRRTPRVDDSGRPPLAAPRDSSAAPRLPRLERAPAPQRGGTVTIAHAHGSTTDSLDPGTYENDYTIELAFASRQQCMHGSLKSKLADLLWHIVDLAVTDNNHTG